MTLTSGSRGWLYCVERRIVQVGGSAPVGDRNMAAPNRYWPGGAARTDPSADGSGRGGQEKNAATVVATSRARQGNRRSWLGTSLRRREAFGGALSEELVADAPRRGKLVAVVHRGAYVFDSRRPGDDQLGVSTPAALSLSSTRSKEELDGRAQAHQLLFAKLHAAAHTHAGGRNVHARRLGQRRLADHSNREDVRPLSSGSPRVGCGFGLVPPGAWPPP